MKKLGFTIVILTFIGLVIPAVAAEFAFHGDMNNRFLVYTNHTDWFNARNDSFGVVHDKTLSDEYAELKYRYWTEIGDDDDNVKGVYAIEIGGIRWGRTGSGKSEGGSFSGDGVNVETRWAYLDFQVPFIERRARARMGLQPFKANEFFWQETATAGHFSSFITDSVDYELAFVRSIDRFNDITDTADNDITNTDSLYGRLNVKPSDEIKVGLFGLYMWGDPDNNGPANFGQIDSRNYEIKEFADDAKLGIYTLGVDGSAGFGNFFVNWDLMYQGGNIDDVDFFYAAPGTPRNSINNAPPDVPNASGDFDLSAYFLHADLGYKMGKAKFTYTFWYSSGDDDPDDNDFDAFLSVDVDRDESVGIFEGLYPDDVSYWTERPYMLTNGFVMNKLSSDYQWTEKLRVGANVMYMMVAEDFDYTDDNGNSQHNDQIGFEVGGYLKYMLYKNVELAVNAGYLFAGDGMDFFEVDKRDGNSDENIFGSSARIRFKF